MVLQLWNVFSIQMYPEDASEPPSLGGEPYTSWAQAIILKIAIWTWQLGLSSLATVQAEMSILQF